VPFILLLLLVPVVVIALTPLLLVQRYRAGTARRLARPWVATLNIVAMAFSTLFFLITASLTTIWFPGTFVSASIGSAIGWVLGGLGLAITRWEPTPHSLHYTPNRWLVLIVTLLVTARVLYGFFRSWSVVQAGTSGLTAVAAFGVPQSVGVAAVVIGYYLAYHAGLRWRIRRWERRPLRRA
jgi:hypothetical protein